MTEFLFDGPEDAHWTLLLAHGAGQGMKSDFMTTMAQQLGAAGVRVARFEFAYMQRATASGRRHPPDRTPVLLENFTAAIEELVALGVPRQRLLIGGKSMGGRMASLIADAQQVAGLICLGYPFHPIGKLDKLRTVHLLEIRTPTLICQGERDAFGKRAEVVEYALSDAVTMAWVPDGDHSFVPRKRAKHTEADNLALAVRFIVDFANELQG